MSEYGLRQKVKKLASPVVENHQGQKSLLIGYQNIPCDQKRKKVLAKDKTLKGRNF